MPDEGAGAAPAKGWEEECVERAQHDEGMSEARARAYCWGARKDAFKGGLTYEETLADLRALYQDETLAETAAKALWAAQVEGIQGDGKLYIDQKAYFGALAAIEEAHGFPTKPAAWVDDCIRRYERQGLSEEEAAHRCYGAYYARRSRLDDPGWLAAFDEAYAQTGDVEKATLAAWGAVNKKNALGIKSENGKALVVGWGMLFTDTSDKDLDGEYFDRLTRTLLDYYPRAPLWMEHGLHPDYGPDPIGYRFTVQVYPRGVWVEHALHEAHPLFARTKANAEAGKYFYSSDTLAHYLEVEPDGYLSFWPVAGWSLTENPAEPALGPVSVKHFEKALKAARLHAVREGQSDENAGRIAATRKGQTRKAQGKEATAPLDPDIGGTMNEELLNALAQALGVEATEGAVTDAMETLIAQVRGEEPEPGASAAPAQMDVDMAALRAALGLGEDADEATVAEALAAVLALLTAPAEPELAMSAASAKSLDYEALRRASEAAAKRAAEAQPDGLPYLVRAPGATKTRGVAAFTRGARPSGIADLVVAHCNGDTRTLKALKAAGYNDGPSGGYMLNRLTSDEIIQPLYAKEVVMAAGARVERFEGAESLTVRKMKAGAAAYWAGAGQTVDDAEAQWGVVNLQPKELVARTLVHNRTLRHANPRLEQSLRDDIAKAIRLAMDKAFLLGTGAMPGTGHSGAEPLGLLNVPTVTKTSLGANGARPKISDLIDAYGRIEDDNVELTEDTAWVFAPRTKRTFTGMADANGQPLLRAGGWKSGEEDALLGYKWFTTTQVPINLEVGTNSDCSYIFLGVWTEAVVGISLDVELVIDTSRYINERQTLIQAVTYVDFGVFYPEAFEVLTGVRP